MNKRFRVVRRPVRSKAEPSDRHTPPVTAAVTPSPLRPPRHLSSESRRWFMAMAAQRPYSPGDLRLLVLCAQAFDDVQRAREEIRRDGATVKTRTGFLRPHPSVQREIDARRDFMRLICALDLAVTPANPAHSADLVSFPDDSMSEV